VPHVLEFSIALILIALIATALACYDRKSVPASQTVPPRPEPAPGSARVLTGTLNVSRPARGGVEGLEIAYADNGLVRSVRVGAMNSEHKELLLTMDEFQWRRMPAAQKQEVLAAARGTWAKKMCASGPDVAYVVIRTEYGDIVGRADPQMVRVL
jgi:hypothetical protein